MNRTNGRIDARLGVCGNNFKSAEALDQRDINDAGRLPASATDDANVLRIDIEKCLEAFDPLGEQFPTMDENERIAPPLSN